MKTKSALVQEIEKRINAYISDSIEAKQSIKIAYLFGSVLHPEKFRPKSDIDLAFLLYPSLYKEDPLISSSPAYMAATEIGLMANRQTDVIILNAASIETTYQVVTTGIVLYEADHENRHQPFLQKLRGKNLIEDSVSEAIIDMKLGLAMEEADTGEYVSDETIFSKLKK